MKYFAIINDNRIGPMELPELVEAGLMPDTYVWCKGMADWKQAKEVADICRFFRNRIFDLMHPTAATTGAGNNVEHANVMPMADEDYKGLKRREFYNAVSEQIRQTSTDPEQERIDSGAPPSQLSPLLQILAIILFFPLGIPAFLMARKSKAMWEQGEIKESYQTAPTAKMYGGIAICIGIIAISILLQWFLNR